MKNLSKIKLRNFSLNMNKNLIFANVVRQMEKEPKIYVRKKFICYLFLCVFIFEKNVERSSNVNRNRIILLLLTTLCVKWERDKSILHLVFLNYYT